MSAVLTPPTKNSNTFSAAAAAAAAATTATSTASMIEATKKSLSALSAQRESIELEADVIIAELKAPTYPNDTSTGAAGAGAGAGGEGGPPMGIDTLLTDRDGYPRGDIDIVRARSLRGRLAQLKTDHASVTKQVETFLHQLAALQDSQQTEAQKAEYAARRAPKPKPRYDPVTGKWVVQSWDGTMAGISAQEGAEAAAAGRSFDALSSGVPIATVHLEDGETAASTTTEGISRLSLNPNPPAEGTLSATTTTPGMTPAVVHQPQLAAQTDDRREQLLPLPTVPFARVDAVAPESPAAAAGLEPGDLVTAFGDVTVDSTHPNQTLHAISVLVPVLAGEQQKVTLVVLRSTAPSSGSGSSSGSSLVPVELELTPRPWNGRGLIGCHIVPYSN